MTVFGDPNSFALIVEKLQIWNDGAGYENGIFHFVVDQRIFPRRARVSTLSADLGCLSAGNALVDFPENDAISSLGTEDAFRFLLNGMLPYLLMDENDIPDDFETDYTYQASTNNLEDDGCFAFAIGKGNMVRILAAEIEKVPHGEARRITALSEVWIEKDEVSAIISRAKSALDQGML
ncbi:immunity 42 family protein [Stenotrophomonas sp. PD6]|uniref:immunity 42 family protein n=1 Tax=Stenotrophomonas sp. PD6 TaxID=3368612 RepID=UPI003BA23E10